MRGKRKDSLIKQVGQSDRAGRLNSFTDKQGVAKCGMEAGKRDRACRIVTRAGRGGKAE